MEKDVELHRQPGCWLRSSHTFKECVIAHWSSDCAPKMSGDLSAQGNHIALALPFVLGLGMALPWPFAGAGMQVLPKPGAWMKTVNKIFGLVVLGQIGRAHV